MGRHHGPWRKEQFSSLFDRHNLVFYSPDEPTNYPRGKGAPAALDHLACTHHFSEVKSEILDRRKVPVNVSTHLPVLWSYKIEEEESPEIKAITEVTAKRIPRPDWRHKVDFELFNRIEPIYVRVAVEITRNFPPAWKAKTVEVILAAASSRARMILPEQQERSQRARLWYAKEIKNVTEQLRWKRRKLAGEFLFVELSELEEMFPGDKKVTVIRQLEQKLAVLKTKLNIELNRILSEEAEKDNADLLVTMRSGDSSNFHANARVNQVIVNDCPKILHHEGKIYTGPEVLKCFAEAAVKESGGTEMIPGTVPSYDQVLKKETVMMAEYCATYDNTYFVELSVENFKKVMAKLPSNKAPDIFGCVSEHFKYSSDTTNILMCEIVNEILKDIRQFADSFISLSVGKYIHKGKNRNPCLVRSYRRICVGSLTQKFIQRLVEYQCTQVVSAHAATNQWGFTSGTSFLQCPVVRETLTKLSNEKKTPLFCAAADVQSAFSRTNRTCQLFEGNYQGEFGKLFLFSKSFATNTDIVLCCNKQFSERITEEDGSPQGSIRSSGNWKVYSIPLYRNIINSDIGAKFYDLDFGQELVADDSLAMTTSRHRFKLMNDIYMRYAEEFQVTYEFSKLELNVWGVKDPEKVSEGLEFGGHVHKISPQSVHVGLVICQDDKQSVTVNVNRRLAKTNAKTWAVMSKCWSRHKNIHILVHREMIRSITKPMLLSGLQALTIPDTGIKPLSNYQDKMIRKTASVRKKASVILLEMILQVSPLLADYHKSVLALMFNMWITRGSCYELVIKILEDKTLKKDYWPKNLNKILAFGNIQTLIIFNETMPMQPTNF